MDSRPHPESLNDIFFQDIFIRIIFLLSTLLGIFPCRYRNGQFFASIPLCIWSFLLACLTSYSTVSFHINQFIPNSGVSFLLFGTITQVIVSLWFCFCYWIFYLVGVTNSVIRMRHTNKILLVLNEVDRKLALLGIRRCWRQQAKYFAKTYFVGLMVVILFYVLYPLLNFCTFLKVPFFFPFFCVWLSTANFTSLADQITYRLDETCVALNDVFMRHSSISDKKLVTLTQVHDKLCDIYIILDRSYAWLITCVFSVCFNGIFIPFYILLTAVYIAETGLNANQTALAACWITISFHTIWQIISTTTGITMKLRGFNLTLFKLMMSDKRNEVLRNNKLRLHISVKREVVFTGKGFFKLDYTLIQSIIASATTYLVILIQFTPGEDEPVDILNSEINNTTHFPVSSISVINA